MGQNGDGIEAALLSHEIPPASVTTIAPTPPLKVREKPIVSIDRCFEEVNRAIKTITEKDEHARIILIGRSFGAFLGLLAAIRLKFERIAKVIMIEGPMNPNIEVTAPTALPMLRLCGKHYDERVDRALAAHTELNNPNVEYRKQLVMIQPQAADAVVPNQAHVLPGRYPRAAYDTDESSRTNIIQLAKNGGLVIQLPDTYIGKGTGLIAALPQNYQNHLEWSSNKMDAVVDSVFLISESL